jgi:hypothetical protein
MTLPAALSTPGCGDSTMLLALMCASDSARAMACDGLSDVVRVGRALCSVLLSNRLQTLVNLLFSQRAEVGCGALVAISTGTADDTNLDLALLEVDAQHRAESGDGELNDLLPVALCAVLVSQLLLEVVHGFLCLGTRGGGLVTDKVTGGIALVELRTKLRVDRDERCGNA